MPHKDEHIICPNCGFQTSENYCARCGQETHLHNETFGGLVMHFIGHYFHYDSKFWQTIKALWFSPGKLTLAYWNKQRMRYIAPVSLYIFMSAVFFLVFFLVPKDKNNVVQNYNVQTDSTKYKENGDHFTISLGSKTWTTDIGKKKDRNDTTGVNANEKVIDPEQIKERGLHMLPKVFFFMIPLMGFILLLLFYRRKNLNYVNHIIFALHYHTFWFSVMLLKVIYYFKTGGGVVTSIVYLASVVYFIVALRNVYRVSWLRSISYSLVVAATYLLFFILVMLATFLIILFA